jgi:hypothetical protein
MKMEKTIFDADPACSQGHCPKFVVDIKNNTVSLIDKNGNKSAMTISEFNCFIRAVQRKEIEELRSQ